MSDPNSTGPLRDDALFETLRDGYAPAPLLPLERARLRMRVRAKLADEAGHRRQTRRGGGVLPAGLALAGAIVVMAFVLPPRGGVDLGLDPLTPEELSAAALLLTDEDVLRGPGLDGELLLPPDYRTLAEILDERV